VHSTVRRLVFGPEPDHLTHLGLYVATVALPDPADRADTILMHNEPGTAIALHPSTGRPTAIFIFRSSARTDPRHTDAADRLLVDSYRAAGWRAPEFLAAYRASHDTYFDSVCRVRVPTWTKGRVALLGDAASCVSLLGEGSSSAIVGAATLATSLQRSPQNLPAALAQYEAIHRPVTARGQRAAPFASHLLVPASATGIALRNHALQLAHAIGFRGRSSS
jgi:2-polyprenyl-6-methoxyphenol hydroxylase-like FAD-dependent oxidoreductase